MTNRVVSILISGQCPCLSGGNEAMIEEDLKSHDLWVTGLSGQEIILYKVGSGRRDGHSAAADCQDAKEQVTEIEFNVVFICFC